MVFRKGVKIRFFILFIGAVLTVGMFQSAQAQNLTALPSQVRVGESLIIISDKDNTFDKNPVRNVLSFTLVERHPGTPGQTPPATPAPPTPGAPAVKPDNQKASSVPAKKGQQPPGTTQPSATGKKAQPASGSPSQTFKEPPPVKAEYVDAAGRTMMARVPVGAVSGPVQVKKGSEEIGVVYVTIQGASWDSFIYIIVAGTPILFFLILCGLLVYICQYQSDWKLSEALSEPVLDQQVDKEENGDIRRDDKQNPKYIYHTKYMNSSSRLIGFLGLLAIIVAIITVLVPAVLWFLRTGQIPDMGNITNFLYVMAGFFAPYIVNKITGIFKKPEQPGQ